MTRRQRGFVQQKSPALNHDPSRHLRLNLSLDILPKRQWSEVIREFREVTSEVWGPVAAELRESRPF